MPQTPTHGVCRVTTRALVLLMACSTCGVCCVAAGKEAAQWIVVTAPAFRTPLAPLCDRRRAEGLSVVIVETTDVLSTKQIFRGDSLPLKAYLNKQCRDVEGPDYVLLVGAVKAADAAAAEKTVVPPLSGTIGRMKGQPSDNGYGCLTRELLPTVAVGRFPARSVQEVRHMVQKTLSIERDRLPGSWRNRLVLLAGNPGGATWLEKRFAEWFVQSAVWARFHRLHPSWRVQALFHSPLSRFCPPDNRLHGLATRYLQNGYVFSFFLGHSSASGFWSQDVRFMNRDDWRKLRIPRGQGVFFTCGCFGCQMGGAGGEGYGLAAIRNPGGPVAVIGAHGESYAAMGQLAFDGMLKCLSAPQPPSRLSDYVLAVKAGLARGEIDPVTFYLCDQVDGSKGTIPLATQREEHLEMWMLLGDPALRLPLLPLDVRLQATGPVLPGKLISVKGSVPHRLAGATVRITLERPIGSPPTGLEALPNGSAERRDRVMTDNHRRANNVVLTTHQVQLQARSFTCAVRLPAKLPWARLVVRACAASKTEAALGILTLRVSK